MSCSCAMRRATGVTRSLAPSASFSTSGSSTFGSTAEGCASCFVASVSTGFVCCLFPSTTSVAASFVLDSSMIPRTSPIFTSSPCCRSMRARMPSVSAATSNVTLSVSRTTSASPAATPSPVFFSHSAMVASMTDSPRSGTTILVGMALSPAGCELIPR